MSTCQSLMNRLDLEKHIAQLTERETFLNENEIKSLCEKVDFK